jgi:hypothetical protein
MEPSQPSPSFNVDIHTPEIDVEGKYPYRKNVTARLYLTGPLLRSFRGIALGGAVLPNQDQLVLWCYAECSSCMSSPQPRCSPIGWYLAPVWDRKYNQGFQLDWSSDTLTGAVTFTIDHRPRRPKGQTLSRRCASEALT